MRLWGQPVAAGGKRFGLLKRFRGLKRSNCLRPVAPLFSTTFPSFPPPARSAVRRTDDVGAENWRSGSPLTPSLTEGSPSDPLSSRGSAEGMAATNRDDEPLRVREACWRAVGTGPWLWGPSGKSPDRHLPVCGGAAGSCTVTRSPPAARGLRVRVPSCAWVMLLTIARPRPTPAWSVRMRLVPR
jgi:hypothetical protein